MIVLLNGAPRSGKSSIARALQVASDGPVVILGVDATMAGTPASHQPGIGLRPGGERPDLEDFVLRCYRALFDSIAAYGSHGIDVASDLGVHDAYSEPLGIWREAAERLAGLAVHVVGVRCPIETILERRAADPDRYEVAAGDRIPDPIVRWQEAVHDPGWYDLDVDTSNHTPADCATAILAHVDRSAPVALDRHRSAP